MDRWIDRASLESAINLSQKSITAVHQAAVVQILTVPSVLTGCWPPTLEPTRTGLSLSFPLWDIWDSVLSTQSLILWSGRDSLFVFGIFVSL